MIGALLVVGVACDATGPGGAESCGADVSEPWRADRATRSPDGQGFCCEPGYPTCDCGYFGGFVREPCDCGRTGPGSPQGYCDLSPADWIAETDEHGCQRYTARSWATACCNCSDGGPADAGTPDAAPSDAAPQDAD